MAYDETLAGRIRDELASRTGFIEKKMFGGVCFLLNGNICVGVWKESLLVRLSADEGAAALYEAHVRQFDITGRPMKGWIVVDPEGLEEDLAVKEWIHRASEFVITLPIKG